MKKRRLYPPGTLLKIKNDTVLDSAWSGVLTIIITIPNEELVYDYATKPISGLYIANNPLQLTHTEVELVALPTNLMKLVFP